MQRLRKQKGLSQAALGAALNVSRQTINAIEAGRYDPSLPLALSIACYFETTVEEIFHREGRCPAQWPDSRMSHFGTHSHTDF